MSGLGNKNDSSTLILSLVALFLAIVFSIKTFSGQINDSSLTNSEDPFDRAQAAAQAGLEIAQWDIECHGRTMHGSLAPRYWINGATFAVEWDDVNMADSTVSVRSVGEASNPDDLNYQAVKEAKIKLTFLPQGKNDILSDYYSKDRTSIVGR